ncbi:MAG: universal stress protein [Candidatus Promineifilaceae bacterium]
MPLLAYTNALEDFRQARSRAVLTELLARLSGRSAELLDYDEVRRMLRSSGVISQAVEDIPISAIIGSVGRYQDFTRDFLPRLASDQERWARVMTANTSQAGLPPVDVFQLGDAYFVSDGHHRVSVARRLGADTIEACVTRVRSRVPLSADDRPEDVIIKAEFADFLERTGLDRLRPGWDLSVTEAGQYQKLFGHVEVHHYYMGLEQQRDIPFLEAVEHWFDQVYRPVVEAIRELGILRDFPGRTEADLYLWIGQHREELVEALEWDIAYEAAAADVAARGAAARPGVFGALGRLVLDVVGPGPQSGFQGLQQRLAARPADQLFLDVMTPVSGQEVGWTALKQAAVIIRREAGQVLGLHVVPAGVPADSPEVDEIRQGFIQRCQELQVPGHFAVETGPVARVIAHRSRWVDLIVANLAHPPEGRAIRWQNAGFRTLIKRSGRPVLATPGVVSALARPLLAYSGRGRARNALYVATYLGGRLESPLDVVHVGEGQEAGAGALSEAAAYLSEHGVEFSAEARSGPIAESLLAAAAERGCDYLIVGGYGAPAVVGVLQGSALDELLQLTRLPLLICP